MSSDITRYDLRAWPKPRTNHRPVTDEEFDRLAREQGYVKPFHRVEVPLDLSTMDATDRAKALRALLTDECDICGGLGYGDVYQPVTNPIPERMTCGRCGGRGWLPKDGVFLHEMFTAGPNDPQWVLIPMDWLEAEDE